MNIHSLLSGLSPEQHQAVNSIREGNNVFITGKAGTGKSHIINILKMLYNDKGIEITATTGIAAVNIGGATIHSFSGIGTGDVPVEFVVKRLKSARSRQLRKRIKDCKILVIDEISMLSGDILDKINAVFKIIRDRATPFGGIQIVLVGDFAQLPPVSRDKLFEYAFESEAWHEMGLKTHVLRTIFRQTDEEFIGLLNRVRTNSLTANDIAILKARENLKPDFNNLTIISTHNAQVDKINNYFMAKLETNLKSFTMNEYGSNQDKVEYLKKYCLAPSVLELKIGARVMMLRNTYYKEGIINGSTGVVLDFMNYKGNILPLVKFDNGVEKLVEYEAWALEELEMETGRIHEVASITQLPLALAWGITVHKSQGMSIERIFCDLGSAFTHGQVYVALSRAKSLSGLYLKNFNPNKIIVDERVKEFEESL